MPHVFYPKNSRAAYAKHCNQCVFLAEVEEEEKMRLWYKKGSRPVPHCNGALVCSMSIARVVIHAPFDIVL